MTKLFLKTWRKVVTSWAAYAAWSVGFRLLSLTLLTYFLISAKSSFQDISDSYSANELTLLGLGTFCFILLLLALHPLTTTTREELVSGYRLEKQFIPGLLQGSILAVSLVLAFLIAGFYSYVGFFIQLEGFPLAMLSIVLRTSALLGLVVGEEYVFRQRIQNHLRSQYPDLTSVLLTSALYLGLKIIQFDLGWLQSFTLFLLSISLGLRALENIDVLRGAGYWAGLLLVFHPLLSLPVLGSEFQGVLTVKYDLQSDSIGDGARWITGGLGGPLSSMGLQLILLADIANQFVKNKKLLGSGWLRRIN
jgi:hypothetical protein